ncbi:MAG: hypothetical protein IKP05_01000 [Alphaproteobacteria bacterium]|nr:hypothetical protein [Alphaproteobacteria bacterium]
MKKQLSLLAVAAALVSVAPAYSATNMGARAGSSAELSGAPATRTRQSVDYAKYQTRSNTSTYQRQDGKNIYYTQPANRSAMYKQYNSSSESVRSSRSETLRTELRRKYYLAHPFYQPLQGKFGSITDLSYASSSYDFINESIAGVDGTWNVGQFAIKEDFSYGITDKLALVGMLRYESTDYEIDWKNDPSDKDDDNGLNLFGIGAQWRMIDTADWIGELSGYFQHQKDVSNNYMLELKAGYKVSRSTIYGLLRGWYIDVDGEAYGDGINAANDVVVFIAQELDDKAIYVEGGLGVFSVLDEDWTLNVEGLFSHYDWHNQFSVKGEIGWQPNDWFAVSLYAKASLYDSANDKDLKLYWYDPSVPGLDTGLTYIGDVNLDSYQDWSIGTRVIFQF